MGRLRFLLRTLWYFRLPNLAVALSVAVGTAVLVGSLVVGDSVRASLTEIVMARLGNVDHVLVTRSMFGDSLPDRMASHADFSNSFERAEALLWSTGSASAPTTGSLASNVNVFGRRDVADGTCVLSVRLASQLRVSAGDAVVLRMDPMNSVASELPVGVERTDIASLRLEVARVADEGGFEDAFSFHGGQRPVRNAWIPLSRMQRAVEVDRLANVLLVEAREGHQARADAATLNRILAEVVELPDYGLKLVSIPGGGLGLESRSILLDERIEAAARRAYTGANVAYAYLANTVRDLDSSRTFPYSMVAGLRTLAGRAIPSGAIVLNAWAAEQLDAKPGDRVELTYVLRGDTGLLVEHTATFSVSRIVPMTGLGADKTLVPEFPGLTDADSVSTWDPPRDLGFQSDRIRDVDEEYWDEHRAAPKAFVALDDARRLWGTAWGGATQMRLPDGDDRGVQKRLLAELTPRDASLAFRAIRDRQLAGAGGNTDFGQLFIGFNFFLVISAALLVVLIMRLSVNQRRRQVGVMNALGFHPRATRRLFLAEAWLVLLVGVCAGAGLSLAYAAVMIAGLRTLWIGAVGTTQLRLAATAPTVLIGSVAGFAVGAIAVWRGLSRLGATRAASALSGRSATDVHAASPSARWSLPFGVVSLVAAVSVAVIAATTSMLDTTSAFFLAGIVFLTGSLALIRFWLGGASRPAIADDRVTLSTRLLAIRNAARNPTRSMLTAGLVASAAFITVAVGSMKGQSAIARKAPGEGQSGYTLVAEFDIPLPYDLNVAKGRSLLAIRGDEDFWRNVRFTNMLVNSGEDVSCRNLYSPGDPRVTSVPPRFVEANPFSFASSAVEIDNPWLLLDRELPSGATPAILDYGTARWIMHKGIGDLVPVTDADGVERQLEIVALLKQSMFQAEVLVSETGFRRLFPATTAFGQILVSTPPEDAARIRAALADDLADFGIAVEGTNERVAAFAAIADSYIDAFSALGRLGLLLGSLGLVVVLMRSVAERRAEFAMMSALGLARRRIAALLIYENSTLLVVGLAAGIAGSLVAISPEFLRAEGDIGSVLFTVGSFAAMAFIVVAALALASAALVRRITAADLRIE